MFNESQETFQYDSCISRGICSINPRNSALQTVIVLYLRLFAKYASTVSISEDCENFILNTIAITIYNPEFNENSFVFAIENFKKELPKIIEEYFKSATKDFDLERKKTVELFNETSDIIQAIRFGEKIFTKGQDTIPTEIRNLYNIMLVIAKSLSINLLDLKSFGKESKETFQEILNLLSEINIEENSLETLKIKIHNAVKVDIKLMRKLRNTQERRYGKQREKEVSYSTSPSKAVLVVGSNIRELEIVLEALKENDIDIYTHDDMMLAHTFPKFTDYPHLKGQFGQGVENCLLDFATFPGPIILTKHSLHNIENFYRGRLFTTDYTSSPKGIIKINDDDFSKVIESAKLAKGFKKGKKCESITIGFDYKNIIEKIQNKIESKNYNKIFIIGSDGYSLEHHSYFEKLIKLTPKNILILSFSYNIEKENLIHVNSCFDYYSWIKIFEFTHQLKVNTTIFVPKCERDTISQIIYLSIFKNTQIYLGKCTPIILNPSLMKTLENTFKIRKITSVKKDLEEILEDK